MSMEAETTVADETKPIDLPEGEYAIVECLGHTTLIGRCEEVERFGSKMLKIEVIWQGRLLQPTFRGGSSLYAYTPCSREVAVERCAKNSWDLPVAVRAAMPPLLLAKAEANELEEIPF